MVYRFGSTFSGNPLACACAIAAVDVVIEEKLSERALALGEKLEKRLSKISSKHFADFRGRGLFYSLFLHESAPRVTGRRWAALLMQRGIVTFDYGDKIRIAPPLSIDENDLWHAVDEIEKALNDIDTIETDIVGRPSS
jgi:ornithine--oxo-acid transaminase